MTLPQRTTTVPTPDEIARAGHLAAEQLTNPKYVAGYLGGEMQALLRKFPDEPGIRACTALWVAHVRATVHGPVADQRANAAVLRHLRNHDDRPPAALRQEFPAELGEPPAEFLIWSQHHQAWFGPNGCGYRSNVADAGRYALADTKQWLTRGCECCQVPEVVVPAPDVEVLDLARHTFAEVTARVDAAIKERIAAGDINKFAEVAR